jgi:hypothetical protein
MIYSASLALPTSLLDPRLFDALLFARQGLLASAPRTVRPQVCLASAASGPERSFIMGMLASTKALAGNFKRVSSTAALTTESQPGDKPRRPRAASAIYRPVIPVTIARSHSASRYAKAASCCASSRPCGARSSTADTVLICMEMYSRHLFLLLRRRFHDDLLTVASAFGSTG